MAKMEIQIGEDNPILRQRSEEVGRIDGAMKKFLKEMKKVMLKKDGLGLAAPQVGHNFRIIIVTLNYESPEAVVMAMLNPEILSFGEDVDVKEEGCLSLPGIYEKVERPTRVSVKFMDASGGEQILELSGLNARVVQHETDHLNGVLFIDRVGKAWEKGLSSFA